MHKWMYSGYQELMSTGVTGKTLDAILVDANDTLDQSGNRFVSDISANELSGGNYTRIPLTGVVMIENQNGHAVVFSGDDVIFPLVNAGTAAVAYIVIRHASGDASSKLVVRIDDDDIVTNGGDVTLQADQDDGFGVIDL